MVACGKRAGAFTCLLDETGRYDSPEYTNVEFKPDYKELSLAVVQPSIWCNDCISIVCGSQKVQASDITCGPGHGISFGSLGSGKSVGHVSDVVVNGVRIKTWQSILVVLLLGVKLLGCYAAGLFGA
ncbi:Polygalacturonase-2 [Camellia lanceoleosa]|uniref:Polygalacturonase-2 n=1 Tax=Camellia lanceoleosa TaxID=1840588 RepID=A0ACC0HCT7_9ERIC|nr:Polygalacturonase-2 [Camellia lanceoleosa]